MSRAQDRQHRSLLDALGVLESEAASLRAIVASLAPPVAPAIAPPAVAPPVAAPPASAPLVAPVIAPPVAAPPAAAPPVVAPAPVIAPQPVAPIPPPRDGSPRGGEDGDVMDYTPDSSTPRPCRELPTAASYRARFRPLGPPPSTRFAPPRPTLGDIATSSASRTPELEAYPYHTTPMVPVTPLARPPIAPTQPSTTYVAPPAAAPVAAPVMASPPVVPPKVIVLSDDDDDDLGHDDDHDDGHGIRPDDFDDEDPEEPSFEDDLEE
ncbi:hypothetical protein GUJ93_ZPchr0010g9970 [Zizania palustris]|uniref:Uncharacterized protein n=1 Tax=Zizania palustris TaxID=103762 RepID=A0A8J5W7N8_ZIZPA|nr:hypothetical protein GUJ93_ZPchr0010g9970 [Zizania palustris]